MQQQVWTMKIRPHEKLWHIDFKEIWHYRDLIELFVRRNIVVQYKQTILGPLWYLIQPILTVIMNMVVFGGIAKMSTDGMPQAIFYMAGNICWFYFSDCLNQTSNTFTANQNMFGKPGAFLYGRQHLLVLFLLLPEPVVKHVHSQPEYVWQGLFPPSGGAHRCGDIQFVAICHTGRTLCHTLSLFLYGRCSYSPQLGYSAYAPLGHDAGRFGLRLWHPDILAHHKVSRLYDTLHLYRPTLDVCYAYCLSTQHGGRRAPTHTDYGQPDDLHHRGVQVCHAGAGLFLLVCLRL